MLKIILGTTLTTIPLAGTPVAIYKIISHPQKSLQEKIEKFEKELEGQLKETQKKLEELEQKIEELKNKLIKQKKDYYGNFYKLKDIYANFDNLIKHEKNDQKQQSKSNQKTKELEEKIAKIVQEIEASNPKIEKETQELYLALRYLHQWNHYYLQLKDQQKNLETKSTKTFK